MHLNFKGKVVLVTGGARGIGKAIVRQFANAGADVVFCDNNASAGKSYAGQLHAEGASCLFVLADITHGDRVKAVVEKTVQTYGRVDILINNAGVNARGDLATRPISEWERVIHTNLSAPYLFAKYASPSMPPGGAIINIASTRALMSEADTEPYSASKGGLVALTHSLAVSLSKQRIRVNAISPGWIHSANGAAPVLTDIDHAQHPAGRVGTPDDIAYAALFLASEQASFITGQNLIVDGGMTVKMIYADSQ